MMHKRMRRVVGVGREACGEAGGAATGRERPETAVAAVSRRPSVVGRAADRGNQGKTTRRIMFET